MKRHRRLLGTIGVVIAFIAGACSSDPVGVTVNGQNPAHINCYNVDPDDSGHCLDNPNDTIWPCMPGHWQNCAGTSFASNQTWQNAVETAIASIRTNNDPWCEDAVYGLESLSWDQIREYHYNGVDLAQTTWQQSAGFSASIMFLSDTTMSSSYSNLAQTLVHEYLHYWLNIPDQNHEPYIDSFATDCFSVFIRSPAKRLTRLTVSGPPTKEGM